MISFKQEFLFFIIVSFIGNSQMYAQHNSDKTIRIKWTKEMLNKLRKMNAHKNKRPKTPIKSLAKSSKGTKPKEDVSIQKMKKDSMSVHEFVNQELVDKLIQRSLKNQNTGVHPLMGMSVFQGYYETNTAKQKGMSADWRWLVPKDFIKNLPHPELIDCINRWQTWFPGGGKGTLGPMPQSHFNIRGGVIDFGTNCSLEGIAEFLFRHHRHKDKNHWIDYASYLSEKSLENVPVEKSDSLVHISMINANNPEQIPGDCNKYKIVYFFCHDDRKVNNANFNSICLYVKMHESKYELVPCSDIDSVAKAALFLKHSGYFKQAYTIYNIGGVLDKFCKIVKWKEKTIKPTLFILDDKNTILKAIKEEDINAALQSLP